MPFVEVNIQEEIEKRRQESPEFRKLWDETRGEFSNAFILGRPGVGRAIHPPAWRCAYCDNLNDCEDMKCTVCGAARKNTPVVEQNDVNESKTQSDQKPEVENKEKTSSSFYWVNILMYLYIAVMLFSLSNLIYFVVKEVKVGPIERTVTKQGYELLEYKKNKDDTWTCVVEDKNYEEFTIYLKESAVSETGYKIVDSIE